MVILGDITESLYWEWRCASSEVNLSKNEKTVAEIKYEMMLKDLEIARLKTALFKSTLATYGEKVSLKQKEYEETKAKIEKLIGKPLSEGCVINDQLQVIELENPKEEQKDK